MYTNAGVADTGLSVPPSPKAHHLKRTNERTNERSLNELSWSGAHLARTWNWKEGSRLPVLKRKAITQDREISRDNQVVPSADRYGQRSDEVTVHEEKEAERRTRAKRLPADYIGRHSYVCVQTFSHFVPCVVRATPR